MIMFDDTGFEYRNYSVSKLFNEQTSLFLY